MKKKILSLTMLAAFGAAFLTSCYNDNAEDLYPATSCNLTNVTYSATIKPIISSNCAYSGCHDATTKAGTYDLSTYDGLKVIVDNGGLIGSTNQTSGFSAMPKNGNKLSNCYLSQIQQWITDGALNN